MAFPNVAHSRTISTFTFRGKGQPEHSNAVKMTDEYNKANPNTAT